MIIMVSLCFFRRSALGRITIYSWLKSQKSFVTLSENYTSLDFINDLDVFSKDVVNQIPGGKLTTNI